jgi:hypothetical protein
MCSNTARRIGQIGQAIDDLAAEALAAYGAAARRSPEQSRSGEADAPDARPANDRVGQAGPDSAAAEGSSAAEGSAAGQGEISNADQVVIRLARLWADLAELDPDIARRLPTYEA